MSEIAPHKVKPAEIHQLYPSNINQASTVVTDFVYSDTNKLLFSEKNLLHAIEILGENLEDSHTFYIAATALKFLATLVPDERTDDLDSEEWKFGVDIGRHALQVIADNSRNIEMNIADNPRTGMDLIKIMLTRNTNHKNPYVVGKGISLLNDCKEVVKDRILKQDKYAFRLLRWYAMNGDYNYFKKSVAEACNQGDILNRIQLISIMCSPDSYTVSRVGLGQVDQILRSYHFSKEEMDGLLDAWKNSTETYSFSEAVESNLVTMDNLESRRPGICKKLMKEFKIRCFGRYPANVLIDQSDYLNDKDNPYGVILFPYADHNGAFYQDHDNIDDLASQLEDIHKDNGVRYRLRVYECQNLLQLGKAIVGSFRKWGKIHFCLIGGHGDRESITFGLDEKLERQHINEGVGIKKIFKYFIENPPIGLIACKTGKKSGIGQEISKLGANVVGPKRDTHLKEIKSAFNKGKLSMKMIYAEGTTGKYESGRAK